jgi:DNA polymerase-1
MIEAFKSGQDIHARTAAEIFAVPLNKVSKEQRRLAKVVNFGILYGMSPYGLSQALSIEQDQAAKYIERYFSIHSGIKDYCNRMIDLARDQGYVETLFGFRRYLQNIASPNRFVSESEERIAINSPVQGTAAEILKLAMIRLSAELKNKSGVKLLLTVHDELVVEAPEHDAKRIAEIIKDVMENVVHLAIPIEVETGIGNNWAECK